MSDYKWTAEESALCTLVQKALEDIDVDWHTAERRVAFIRRLYYGWCPRCGEPVERRGVGICYCTRDD